MDDGTTILFGLPGVAVLDVERVDGGRVVHVVTDDVGASACPDCGVFSTKIRQRRTTNPRDVGFGEEPLAVAWHKTQYACQERLCERKAFTECIREVPAGARATGRLRRAAGNAVAAGASVAAAVREHGLSWPIVHAAFIAKANTELADPCPVRVLGIDETRRARPRWSKDPDTGKWVRSDTFETNFFDLDGDGGLLGQAGGRTRKTVIEWLDERGLEWKERVQVVAIDPSATYRSAVREALPNAIIVADHFHLVMLANKALTAVRQRVVRETCQRRGRASDPIWAGRRRLLYGRENLSEKAFTAMVTGLIDNDPTNQILTTWIAKEQLRDLFATARTGGQRHDVAHQLDRFYSWCAAACVDIPEVQRLAATIDAWWPQILAFLQTGITNAKTEGGNHLIKDTARVAFGFGQPRQPTKTSTVGLHTPPTHSRHGMKINPPQVRRTRKRNVVS